MGKEKNGDSEDLNVSIMFMLVKTNKIQGFINSTQAMVKHRNYNCVLNKKRLKGLLFNSSNFTMHRHKMPILRGSPVGNCILYTQNRQLLQYASSTSLQYAGRKQTIVTIWRPVTHSQM